MDVTIFGVNKTAETFFVQIKPYPETSTAFTGGTTNFTTAKPTPTYAIGSAPTPPPTIPSPTLPSETTRAPSQSQTTSSTMKLRNSVHILYVIFLLFVSTF